MFYNTPVLKLYEHSIQLKIFYFQQHIVYIHVYNLFAHDMLKRERAEDRAYVGSFHIIYIIIMIYSTPVHNY